VIHLLGIRWSSYQLRNGSRRRGGFVGGDDLDLDIADWEFPVLPEPSGRGKTATVRMIAGLEDPVDGEIPIGGRDVTRLETKERDVAMVFQGHRADRGLPDIVVGQALEREPGQHLLDGPGPVQGRRRVPRE